MTSTSSLPDVPFKHSDFISYIEKNPEKSLSEIVEPYKQYDAKIREVFAQEPLHPVLADPHLNVVPVFDGHEKSLKIQARNLDNETQEEKDKYVMQLAESDRRPNGSPAVVQDLKEFQQNFTLFCESSLVDLDWSNVVAAGSSVVTCLLPVPEEFKQSKRALRKYYHEDIAPASDVDLFIYGLNEEQAIKKIIEIEKRVKDSILTETTTIRTKNTITIASQYPTRHIQIVLRLYKSVSEILTGFDVDCACAAYDGKQVWAAPRALTAYMTQINTIDLTRRSPSYENRLSKYAHRGFEVYWPLLDRSRIDPTVFERNFGRVVGLARLLVLERLPSKSERERYMDERRSERGRPPINRDRTFATPGNIKEKHEDEVAEWVDQKDVSDYNTFTIPYGPKYYAKKIEKLLYTKDLLLNSEWNKPKTREVNLHRHPAFFGFAEDVVNDCCGFCPEPVTPEEHDVAEEEAKTYVSGKLSFIADDPGRQAIGSFNPITDEDWTEMAYVGNTARLCQAIIDEDLDHVVDWLSQEDSDPNCRDYTGRTPLHLAVTSSSPEIVRALIDHGARLVARLADGRTALHLAAARGNVEMVRMILQKSAENEEEEDKKDDVRKKSRMAAREAKKKENERLPTPMDEDKNEDGDESDVEMIDHEEAESDDDAHSATTGSFIKVEDDKNDGNLILEEKEDDPDVYDVDVLAWDLQCSPLHLAILNGHVDVVKELVQSFGADVLLPIKLLNSYDRSPWGAILTLVLCLSLPLDKAKEMTDTLLSLGASCAQGDKRQVTALHFVSSREPELLDRFLQHDEPAAKRAINHLAILGNSWDISAQSPLMSAIGQGNALAALKLLDNGASASIDFSSWMKSLEHNEKVSRHDAEENKKTFKQYTEQPVILAVQNELPELTRRLIEMGADQNTLTKDTHSTLEHSWRSNELESVLDVVKQKIRELREFLNLQTPMKPSLHVEDGVDHLGEFEEGTYKHFIAQIQLREERTKDEQKMKKYEKRLKTFNEQKEEVSEQSKAIGDLLQKFEDLERFLLDGGAKTAKELHPDHKDHKRDSHSYSKSPPDAFAPSFGFRVGDETDEIKEAFLKMFQAAWDGDLDTIKSFTLGPWGDNNTPLKITVHDNQWFNPFSIAVLRGHLEVAKGIVEISFAQYKPQDESKKQYRIDNEEPDEDEEAGSESSDVPVLGEIVDDKFTLENIGELQTQVHSDVSPLDMISDSYPLYDWLQSFPAEKPYTRGVDNTEINMNDYKGTLPFQAFSFIANDESLFKFLLDLDVEWSKKLAKNSEDTSDIPSLSGFDTDMPISFGRVNMLAELIKHGGAGLQLKSLVERSGVKYREKPKYYEGLSVHGKKRPSWVNAARGTYEQGVVHTSPPLLQAVFKGSLQSVEWFLSDAPARHYLEFAEAHKNDKYIEHLNKNAGGFEKVLRNWLETRNELALHCAVMADPTPEATKLIKYLLSKMPECLEVRSKGGYTPLMLAFSLHRLDAAKLLIEAGADQTARADGSNILHLFLVSEHGRFRFNDLKNPGAFFDLIDKRLVASLLTERDCNSRTPIFSWMRTGSTGKKAASALLDFSAPTNHAFLDLLDESGDTPLHWCVKSENLEMLRQLLAVRPDLLFRENSVGRTPLEIAEDKRLAARAAEIPELRLDSPSIIFRDADSFEAKEDEDAELRAIEGENEVYTLCRKTAMEKPAKRKLVSLLDANEVAKRLTKRQLKASRERKRLERDEEDEDKIVEDHKDEVQEWANQAS